MSEQDYQDEDSDEEFFDEMGSEDESEMDTTQEIYNTDNEEDALEQALDDVLKLSER